MRNVWRAKQTTPEWTSSCRSRTACPTCTRPPSEPLKRPRPPTRSARSSVSAFGDVDTNLQEPPPRNERRGRKAVRGGSNLQRFPIGHGAVRVCTSRRVRRGLGVAFLLGYQVTPLSFRTIVVRAFPHREVRHEIVGRRSVPVPFAGWSDDRVARADLDNL